MIPDEARGKYFPATIAAIQQQGLTTVRRAKVVLSGEVPLFDNSRFNYSRIESRKESIRGRRNNSRNGSLLPLLLLHRTTERTNGRTKKKTQASKRVRSSRVSESTPYTAKHSKIQAMLPACILAPQKNIYRLERRAARKKGSGAVQIRRRPRTAAEPAETVQDAARSQDPRYIKRMMRGRVPVAP